ncbi:hypothetical protein OIU76_019582 [Salix suchowensis]|nr:hypothetical protein OIU76_019582 [Salix suchowensis]
MQVKVILGMVSPRNSVLLPTSPQTPLTVESESPPPPKEILKLKKPSCSEDENDEASIQSSSVQPSSSSEEFSGEDEDEEDSVDEEFSSSDSESNVHYHKDANSVVKYAMKPSEQPAVKSFELPAVTLDEQPAEHASKQPAKQATEQSAEAPIDQPAAQGEGNQISAPLGQWKNLFASNRSSSNCPKLKFYAELSAADECTLLAKDLDVKCAMWKTCLIGYVSGKFPGFKALSAVIDNKFNCEAVLTLHESGWLIYKLKNEKDKLAVLRGGPYLVFGRPLMLREMPEFFNFNSSEMSTLLVWVKLPNLPLSCWSEICLSKIASVIGNPIQCDMLTSSMTRLSYARVLVEIDLLKKLRDYVKVCLPNGEVIEQQIIYETLPKFCSHCNVIGHLVETCTKFAKRNNASATTVVGGQVSVPKGVGVKDVLPTEDVSAEDKWETVKKKHRSNWRPKKTMVKNVRGVVAKAASGVAARVASGMVDAVASAANVVSNGATSGVAAKAVNGMEGLKAGMPSEHNVPPKAMNGLAGKPVSVMGTGEVCLLLVSHPGL